MTEEETESGNVEGWEEHGAVSLGAPISKMSKRTLPG